MSTEAMTWALKKAPPMPAQLVTTLLGLAEHADSKGCGAYPSVPTLAAYACKDPRSIRRDLTALEKLGLIREGDQSKAAHLPADKQPKVYDLAIELVAPGGSRAGKGDESKKAAREMTSSRRRGGRAKSAERGDVGVRSDSRAG